MTEHGIPVFVNINEHNNKNGKNLCLNFGSVLCRKRNTLELNLGKKINS